MYGVAHTVTVIVVEMELVILLDEAVCVSFRANIFEKGMNPFILFLRQQ